MKIKRKDWTPYCGWVYIVPETGVGLDAGSFRELIHKVKVHYRSNRIGLPSHISELIEEFICLKAPEACDGVIKFKLPTKNALENGTRAYADMLVKGEEAFVSEDEANRRASICSHCGHNRGSWGCIVCYTAFKTFMLFSKGRKTKFVTSLNACDICKCFNEVQCWCNDDIIRHASKNLNVEDFPDECWKKKILTEGN